MRLQYVLAEAFRNIGRNLLVVMGAILAVFIALVLALSTLVFGKIVQNNTDQWSEGVRIVAFLRDDLSFEDSNALVEAVRQWETVEDAFYFSKAEALEEARRLLKDRPAAIRFLEEDPSIVLPSVRIKPVEAGEYETIEAGLRNQVGIERVTSAGPAIDNMVALRDGLQFFFVVAVVVLGVSATLLIANTIHMAIYARREEIGIMRLVGAGNWFVRTPFILEGVIEGLVGAALAAGTVIGLHWLGVNVVTGLPEWIDIDVGSGFLIGWSLVILGFGAAVGLIGSGLSLAVHRVLKT